MVYFLRKSKKGHYFFKNAKQQLQDLPHNVVRNDIAL